MAQADTSIDMQLAAAVQEALLSESVPACRCGKMVLQNRMCSDIGGDFYHFRQLGQDQIALAIGDVVGHGTAAALVMTLIMGILRADRPDQRRPSRIIELINNALLKLGDRLDHPITCTLIYGIVDLPSGLLLYINAGHPRPIIFNRRTGGSQELYGSAMMLGVQPGVSEECCHSFLSDDRLVLFTDGITECRDAQDNMFGPEQLGEHVVASGSVDPETLAGDILRRVDSYTNEKPRQDDQTLVVIDFDDIGASV